MRDRGESRGIDALDADAESQRKPDSLSFAVKCRPEAHQARATTTAQGGLARAHGYKTTEIEELKHEVISDYQRRFQRTGG